MDFWCTKGHGESVCFMTGGVHSSFVTQITLVMDSLTTSLISGGGKDQSGCFCANLGM
ncbi:hypothetical protein Hanom_Chr09g00826941 [Helianthus anomalus]